MRYVLSQDPVHVLTPVPLYRMNGLDKYSEEYIEKEIGKNVDIPKDFGVPGPCEDQGKGKIQHKVIFQTKQEDFPLQ